MYAVLIREDHRSPWGLLGTTPQREDADELVGCLVDCGTEDADVLVSHSTDGDPAALVERLNAFVVLDHLGLPLQHSERP